MRCPSIAVVLSLPLAACGSGGPTAKATNASVSEVAAKVDAAGAEVMMSPGRWEGTATMGGMKVPGLPPEQQARMAAAMAKAQTIVSCVTPQQIKDRRAFFTGNKDIDKSCKYDHFTMGGGKLDATMSCSMGGAETAMAMQGSYGTDHYAMTMTMDIKGEGSMGSMTSTTKVDAKRVGACRGDEQG